MGDKVAVATTVHVQDRMMSCSIDIKHHLANLQTVNFVSRIYI